MKKENWGFYAPMWGVLGLLVVEYYFIFHRVLFENFNVWLILAYALLIYMLVCKYHGKSVHLRYEQLLSINMKVMVADVVCFLYSYGITYDNHLWWPGLLMMAVQVLSVWLLNKFCWNIFRCYFLKEKQTLQINDDDNFEEMVAKIEEAEEVFLNDLPACKRNDYLKYCFLKDKPVWFSSKLSDIQMHTTILSEAGDAPMFSYEQIGISKIDAAIKRVADIVGAVILLILLFPIMVLCTIAVKLCDGGPVFYKQVRCTQNMRTFYIYKFRSMVVEAEQLSGPKIADARDPRMTSVGYWLRKFKLDEIPQLINILRGDMSFVGPRPERPEIIEETLNQVPEFIFRTKVKAGLTGYAQVHGDYHTGLLDKLKWDLLYIENYSLLLDVKILIMTIPTVFRGSGDTN